MNLNCIGFVKNKNLFETPAHVEPLGLAYRMCRMLAILKKKSYLMIWFDFFDFNNLVRIAIKNETTINS